MYLFVWPDSCFITTKVLIGFAKKVFDMKQQINHFPVFRALAMVSFLAASTPSMAATNWNLANCSLGAVDATGYQTCNSVDVRATSTNSGNVVNATVYSWDTGLGVVKSGESSSSTGPHSLDNYDGLDALIFKFQQAVSISSITLGWNGSEFNRTVGGVNYNDSDVALYAWTGSNAPGNVSGAGSGWSLIGGKLDNVGNLSNNTVGTTNTTFSSYWLVSAWGSGTASSTDAFKLFSIAGNVSPPITGVSEPGSLALLTMGALGLMAARRRQKNQTS